MSIVLLSQLSILLPIAGGLLFLKRLSNPFRFLLLFFLFSACIEYGAAYFSGLYHNNMPLLHVFTLVEVCSYCYIYSRVFTGNRSFTLLCRSMILIQVMMSLMDAWLVNGIYRFPTLARGTGALILIFLSLYQLYLIFNFTNDPQLLKKSRFWLLFGVLTYFSTIIFFILLVNITVSKDEEAFRLIHNFHASVNILCNFMFAYSFLCFRFRQD